MKVSRFTPSLMQPEDLEAIFVQRHQLAEDIVERISDSVLTLSPHHTLLVGPRGIGKTHLVSLVYHRIRKREALQNRLLIAWLREDEWGVTSFLDLLLRIFRALQENDGDFAKIQVKGEREGLIKRVESLYELSSEEAEQAGAELLKEIIGENSLLLLMENLDDIFSGLGKKGQKQLHAFLQENPGCTILATSQSLFDEVKKEKSPFYEFFHINHLEDLTVEEAIELLANIARVRGDRELESFIRQPRGRDRIQAVHHLAGGNHRVYVIFSEFLTRESLDELVEPFMRMLDDLTPYYQARMASLSPQQRKIVEFLCDRRHGVPVKEIAQRCFLTHQTTSSQLKDLREKGYVMSDAIGRESFYEMRETLMRFCLEVKKQRGEPIQLFVDFLRIWYTKEELLQRLGLTVAEFRKNRVFDDLGKDNYLQYQQRLKPLPSDAVLEREYILYALEAMDNEDEDPRIAACLQEYENCFEKEDYVTALELAEKLVKIRGQAEDWLKRGLCLSNLKRYEKALVSCDKAIELAPHYAPAWGLRGAVLATIERYEEALVSCDKAIELEPDDASAWGLRGWVLDKLKRDEEALVSCDKAIELDPNYAPSWELRGTLLEDLKRYEEALISCDKIIELEPNDTRAWGMRGVVLADLERYEEALICCDKAIELDPNYAPSWELRGTLLEDLKRYEEALISCDKIIELEPNDTRAWGMRGVVLADLERYEEALVSCDKAIELGYQDSSVFLNRAIAILGLNRWDEGIAALENAFQRFTLDNEADADDAKLIMHILFNSSNNVEIWRSRIKTLIELYHKHQVISTLGQGLVKSVPTLMSEMVSDKAAQTWLEMWQELASDYPEFQIPLRLLKAAVGYKETKGNKRVLFSLPIEERKLLEPLLGIADTSAVK